MADSHRKQEKVDVAGEPLLKRPDDPAATKCFGLVDGHRFLVADHLHPADG